MAESIATGCAANLLSEGFIWLFKKVVAPVQVLICLPRAVTQMRKDVKDLGDEIDEIKTELDQAQQRAKPRVNTWLEDAEKLKGRSESIGQQYEAHQQHTSYLGCCPKCLCRYKISKDIRSWNRILAQLRSQRAQSDFPSSGQYGDPTPPTQITIQDPESGFVGQAQRSQWTELAERWLTECSNIQRIGIIGIGGVGKTSLLHAINNSQKVKNSFDLIIKVTVSKDPQILHMQNSVADRLNLQNFKEISDFEARKGKLRSYLQNKRYVILLDDMWAVDAWTSDRLQDLGVSLENEKCKFVLTTRDAEVCAKMHVQETIKVEPLSEEEGWQLFRNRAFGNRAFGNEDGDVPQDIEPVARRFAQECKGLPLAINVVAAAVSHHTTLNEWEVALSEMQSVSEAFYDQHVGVDEQLFKRLRWSYDVLSDSLKTCFLYFAAYPEDQEIEVSEVIDMCICEGLVEESGHSYLHDTWDLHIKQLADRCLIEVVSHGYGRRIGRVKIHDILRDLAIRIAAEQRCCFKAGQSLKSFNFEEVVSKDCVKLSLMTNDLHLHSLPTTFPCRSLSVLLLNWNTDIKEVPERFLCDLSSLKVLDLSGTAITSLPPSIQNLKHLASLQLRQCQWLRELPEAIGDLKGLQFLNVSWCSQLRCLPESITELKHLRVLQMDGCLGLRHLPRGIKELISLEILTMWGTWIELDFEKDANAEGASACLKDLQTLRRLRVFIANIKSPVKEGVMGNWSKMRELRLEFVGGDGHNYLPQDMQVMKDMENFTLTNCDVERVPHFFPKLEYLDVDACKQLKELPTEIPCLTHLTIQRCDKLEELELGKGFPKLESLSLRYLKSLECVGAASGGLGEGASPLPPMLKSLYVEGCPKLKRLRGGWDKLNHLESIGCDKKWWDEILQWEGPNMNSIECEGECWDEILQWEEEDSMKTSPPMKTLLENKCNVWWIDID